MKVPVVDFDVRSLGRHLPRRRYQRGTLKTSVPAHGGRPERRLPRGEFWAEWAVYRRTDDGSEKRLQREKIINREVAVRMGVTLDHIGPLTRSDAQRALDLLIAESSGCYTPPNRQASMAMVAREYLTLREPNWGPREIPVARSVVIRHIVDGKLGGRPIVDLKEAEIQGWLNEYVSSGSSRSLLKKLMRHVRGIFKHAVKQKVIVDNPTVDLRAKSRKAVCERYLTLQECQALLSVLSGRDRLIVRLFIQLGLRPEELFALRRDDVQGDQLRIDEALVFGQSAAVKTEASAAFVYLPPEVTLEMVNWMSRPGKPSDWLFQTTHGRPGFLNPNNYRERILQPAAIRAGVGVTDTGKRDDKGNPVLKTDVDFRCLRRTCGTLFGDKAKDPKSTQTQLRHADPSVTLRHYQKSIPASVKAAAIALEKDLAFGIPGSSTEVN